jgi:hypothetical protein
MVISPLRAAAFRRDEPEGHDDESREKRKKLLSWIDEMATGEPFLRWDRTTSDFTVNNLWFSRCFDCSKFSIWLHERLLYPEVRGGVPPDQNMPIAIRADYDEARSIVDRSPRGAAALLRLCVQKLCKELGGKGKNIDDDIAALVAKGLDPLVQEALDAVRVIGNEAVHPGQMDLQDDRDTADELFAALNFIVDQTISRKRKLAALYEKLPKAKRDAIDQRNAKAKSKTADGS